MKNLLEKFNNQSSALKIIILFGLVFLFLLFVCCGCAGIGALFPSAPETTSNPTATTSSTPTNNPTSTETPIPTQTTITTPTTAVQSQLIDANDFKIKSLSSITTKYGNPDYDYKSTAPTFSLFGYEKEKYSLEANYLSNDTRVFGAKVFFKDTTCNFSKDLTKDQLKVALESVNLSNQYDKDWQYQSSVLMKRFYINNSDNWSSISLSCSDENIYVISFQSVGWDKR